MMSKRRKQNRDENRGKLSARKNRLPRNILFLLAVGVIIGLGLGGWKVASLDSLPRAAARNEVNAGSPAAVTTSPEFQKLKGQWRRPDGGYILAIKSIDDNGGIDAGYFNPDPIHVARAEASQEREATKVFIELRDVNYPGSTYTLTYDPASDQLKGIYYQAVEKQRFPVAFVRLK